MYVYIDTCIFLHNIQSHEKPLICTPVRTHIRSGSGTDLSSEVE